MSLVLGRFSPPFCFLFSTFCFALVVALGWLWVALCHWMLDVRCSMLDVQVPRGGESSIIHHPSSIIHHPLSFILYPSSFAPERPTDLSGMRDFHASAPVSLHVR
jgi:hypothetical protein